jgi:fumarylacetoacetase
MATGTVSGKSKQERGCMLELTWRGTEPVELPNGEQRRFLEDGDEIIMKGYCEREGFRRIGFGECRGRILPAN